ncbi:MAG: hypothetical protein LBR36_09955 [Bacteroidales bacterium]|nr:hypothetical protein [Bacteroidales bacterium]
MNSLNECPCCLYTEKFVNYKSKFRDGRKYSEIVAETILNNLNKFDNIQTITRQRSYKTEEHDGKATTGRNSSNSNRSEEYIAMSMFKLKYEYIGEVLDYQIPIKNVRKDKVGKIDILSFNSITNVTYLLELKAPKAKDTLLHCILEIYTYWKIVDKDKLRRDFDIDVHTDIRKAILVPYNNCNAFTDFLDKSNNQYAHQLMQKLKIDFFVFEMVNKNVQNIQKL